MDQLVFSLIYSSLTEEAMCEVLGSTSSRDAWLALEEFFSNKSKTRELQLKDDLQMIRKGSRTVGEYAREFKNLFEQLNAMGHPVKDTDKVLWFLRGLGASFSSFSTTILSQTHIPTFKDVVHKAQSHALFVKSLDDQSGSVAAFTAQRGGRSFGHGGRFGSGSQQNRGGGRFDRGRHGGRILFTDQRGSSSAAQSSDPHPQRSSSQHSCQICGKTGHLAIVCWERFNPSFHTANIAETFSSCTFQDSQDLDWYTDSGASSYMTNDVGNLDATTPYGGYNKVVVGNGASLPITHTGSLSHSTSLGSISLLDVLVVPSLTKKLIFISKLTTDNNCSITFIGSCFTIQDLLTGVVLGTGRCKDGFYVLDRGQKAFLTSLQNKNLRASLKVWHARLGHSSFRIVEILNKTGGISINSSVSSSPSSICNSCQLGKSHRLPFAPNEKCSSLPLQLIHCDLWGPFCLHLRSGIMLFLWTIIHALHGFILSSTNLISMILFFVFKNSLKINFLIILRPFNVMVAQNLPAYALNITYQLVVLDNVFLVLIHLHKMEKLSGSIATSPRPVSPSFSMLILH
jgi:hypothetical protein